MKTAELNDATEQFHKRFGVYPNLMGGGPELYKKIDEIIQDDLENVVNDKGEHPGPDDVVEIGVFHGIRCRLDFTINETTPFPAFLLIYDEDPQFDGEPEPVEVDGPVVDSRYGVA